MSYYFIIHQEDGTKLRSPNIKPNKPWQDEDDIEVYHHIQKFINGFKRKCEIKNEEM